MCLHVLPSMDIPNQYTDIRLYHDLREGSTDRTVTKDHKGFFDPLPS